MFSAYRMTILVTIAICLVLVSVSFFVTQNKTYVTHTILHAASRLYHGDRVRYGGLMIGFPDGWSKSLFEGEEYVVVRRPDSKLNHPLIIVLDRNGTDADAFSVLKSSVGKTIENQSVIDMASFSGNPYLVTATGQCVDDPAYLCDRISWIPKQSTTVISVYNLKIAERHLVTPLLDSIRLEDEPSLE